MTSIPLAMARKKAKEAVEAAYELGRARGFREGLEAAAAGSLAERAKGDWNDVENIPKHRDVIVLTARGLVRRAKVAMGAVVRKGSISCWRRDGRTGDLKAVGWREIEP